MTLAELQAQREAILKDIDVVAVTWGDRSVTKAIDKRAALAALDQAIAAAKAAEGTPPARHIRMYTNSQGFNS